MNRPALSSILISAAAISLCAVYSVGTLRDEFKIETTSPQGTYRVTFEGKTNPRISPLAEFSSERVKLSVIKAQEIYFVKDPFFGEGALDRHFRGAFPVIEWLNDSALRLGGNLSEQPFHDEIELSNGTKENLGIVEVFYGKYERFLIFDFAPGRHLMLSASPQFSVNLPPASTVIYKATNLATGRERVRMVEGIKRKTPSEGAAKIVVEITDS
jgi:hypothetical protein